MLSNPPFHPLTSVALFTLGGRIIIDNNHNRDQSRNYRGIIMQPQHHVIMIREVVAGANKCQMLTNRRQSCEKVKVITMLYGLISNHSDISCRKYLLRYFSFIFLLFQTKRYIEYRVDIWHDRCNWQSHKILVTCVNFLENNVNCLTFSSPEQ